ncbi:MAG: Fic family protein [Deltaproteobacteria bacterium]|nr:Fic family protein [Deltaproteobacteria bacterium]
MRKKREMPQPYQPPYRVMPRTLSLVEKIGEHLGMIKFASSDAQRPDLHRINRIKTVQGTLEIEGNTLSIDQVTAVLDGKRVLANPRELREVQNAFAVYDALGQWKVDALEDLLSAHRMMMAGLMNEAGRVRSGNVGVHGADRVLHVAPEADRVPGLMEALLGWLDRTDEHPLIASSVFHYLLEFIHPFQDGNGRMGRLWQTLILGHWNPVFRMLPLESMIRDHRSRYYDTIQHCNAAGESTEFIIFVLQMIEEVLADHAGTEHDTEYLTEQVERLIRIIGEDAYASKELMAALNLNHRPTFLYTYLQPAIKAGLIEMTRPQTPAPAIKGTG